MIRVRKIALNGDAISCLTSNASRRGVGQWGGAGGAICEDHFAVSVIVSSRDAGSATDSGLSSNMLTVHSVFSLSHWL